jgi:hypothetical protein
MSPIEIVGYVVVCVLLLIWVVGGGLAERRFANQLKDTPLNRKPVHYCDCSSPLVAMGQCMHCGGER